MPNNKSVRLAFEENKVAENSYKAHLDVLFGFKEKNSDEKEVKSISNIIEDNIAIFNLFSQDFIHVYTMVPLSGIGVIVVGKVFWINER